MYPSDQANGMIRTITDGLRYMGSIYGLYLRALSTTVQISNGLNASCNGQFLYCLHVK